MIDFYPSISTGRVGPVGVGIGDRYNSIMFIFFIYTNVRNINLGFLNKEILEVLSCSSICLLNLFNG